MNPAGSARNQLRGIARRAMLQRGMLPDFSNGALAQAAAITAPAMPDDAAIRDLRHLSWASIDNDDSRDLDQLSVAVPESGGTLRILVAIADVDALVKKDSPIDDHARSNTTSVYTPAQIFPMLPEQLSTDLTSLNENQDRLAIVVDMAIDGGAVQQSDVYRANVRNHAKLAYNSTAAWLEGTQPAPKPIAASADLQQQLRLQDQAAQSMRQLRYDHGALSLQTAEGRAVFDGDVLSDVRTEETNRAKQIIEDFMVAANGVTARFLEDKDFPSLRRVLRSPERWERIVAFAAGYGESLPPEPDAGALDAFLQKRRAVDPVRFPDVSLAVVKLLGRGEYMVEVPGRHSEGHFGLAVRDYTHSTAPNRRFPDLITQRLLKAALAQRRAPYSADDLAALARHCTEQEDNATKVERQVRKSAAALLLESHIGERFDAIVTGAATKGTWVRIAHPAVEGRVVRGFAGLRVGVRTRVELLDTDVERGFIDFARVGL